jgi:hypothetical protein
VDGMVVVTAWRRDVGCRVYLVRGGLHMLGGYAFIDVSCLSCRWGRALFSEVGVGIGVCVCVCR